MPDHVHMMISIPPKYAVSQVIGISSRARVRSILLASMARGNAIYRGTALLGRGGYFSLDDRARRSRHQGVHPEARAGGPAPRSDQSVALTSHRPGGSNTTGPRSAAPTCLLSGHITKAPGSAGGFALSHGLRSISGNLAKLAAMRRASSPALETMINLQGVGTCGHGWTCSLPHPVAIDATADTSHQASA